MKIIPSLHTERLILRPFSLEDAHDVQRLAGERVIAATTLSIPHPYEDGMAEEWISTHAPRFESGDSVVFAITLRDGGALIGAIGLELRKDHNRAELGYWVGVPYWNQGYCTEAARAALRYGFEELHLNRIVATYLSENPASGRVMQKIGMLHEGTLRQHVCRWGEYKDLEFCAILNTAYQESL
jgi:ribosomal-protein-alanine N-acetyltransferase